MTHPFFIEKEEIFNKLYDLQIEFEEREQEITDLQVQEVEKLRELFRTRTKMTWNVVMTQEITLGGHSKTAICALREHSKTTLTRGSSR